MVAEYAHWIETIGNFFRDVFSYLNEDQKTNKSSREREEGGEKIGWERKRDGRGGRKREGVGRRERERERKKGIKEREEGRERGRERKKLKRERERERERERNVYGLSKMTN